MTADTSGTTQDYSTRPRAARSPEDGPGAAGRGLVALRLALALAGLAGAVLLVASTWATVVQIKVLTTSDLVAQDTEVSGSDLHGVALVVVALFALPMLVGALRGARPAQLALAATGVLALALVVFLDVPELDNTGQVAQFYEDVSAGASTGFFLETLGGILLLLSGGLLWVLGADAVAARLTALGTQVGERSDAAAHRRGDRRARRPGARGGRTGARGGGEGARGRRARGAPRAARGRRDDPGGRGDGPHGGHAGRAAGRRTGLIRAERRRPLRRRW